MIDEIEKSLELLRQRLGWDTALHRLDELNARAEDPSLWNDAAHAQKVMRERQKLADGIAGYKALANALNDNVELIELGEMEDDDEIVVEAEKALAKLRTEAAARETEALLSGEVDGNDAFLEVHSGAGGTESCDWAAMLARKSGVHRLVRISPFDGQARRHTSFSSVWVYPVIDDTIEIDIPPNEIRIDTYRSQGAGGQHVNTTDSAVGITHIPTNIVVTSSEKSQHQNRANCMAALRSRLYDMEMKRRTQSIQDAHDAKSDIGWGHQIRSYVLQPYQMVKDLRTGVETSDTGGVLDGDLDTFMGAALAQEVSGKSRAEALEEET
jgi:peptide chain release factor 2